MDLVFKRYTNPYFLDLCIENNQLNELIDTILQQIDEEKMWELYLSTAQFNEKSFIDWKSEFVKTDAQVQIMSKEERDATIKNVDDILKKFKPPKEGGFYKC